jgi:tetratricopeptide (TPR) repeat protein
MKDRWLDELKHALACYQTGLSLSERGCHDQAILCFKETVDLLPGFFEAWVKLATIYCANHELDSAVFCAERAVASRPYLSRGFDVLAEALGANGDSDGATRARQLSEENQKNAFLTRLREVFASIREGRTNEACDAAQAALKFAPTSPEANYACGVLLLSQDLVEDATEFFKQAVQLDPTVCDSWIMLANANLFGNHTAAARVCCDQALVCASNNPAALYGRALIDLVTGSFRRESWVAFEQRWNVNLTRHPTVPRWQGEELSGQTILLFGHQGYGDAMQFARYFRCLARRGAEVVLECHPILKRLMQSAPGLKQVIGIDEPVPSVDLAVSLFSLPRIFETNLGSIPGEFPYLSVPPGVCVELPNGQAGHKVGIVWACGGERIYNQARWMPLLEMAPVFEVPGVDFYSLQVGPEASQLTTTPGAKGLIDLGPQLIDFAATAVAISKLDLVICVDTAVAHLAGALDKPFWVIVPFAPDWRWMLDREDSPWYPTARVFRQTRRASWSDVVFRVAHELKERVSSLQSVTARKF